MKAIWKYPIVLSDVEERFTIPMPRDSRVVCVGNQYGDLCFWAEVETAEVRKQGYKFLVVGTGHKIREPNSFEYLDTVQFLDGRLIFHIYQEIT